MTDLGIRPPADMLRGTLFGARRAAGTSANNELGYGTLTASRVCPRVEYTFIEPVGAPAWLQVMVADINRAAQLPVNWDSYGAERLKQKAAIHGLELLERMDFGGPAPWVSPSKEGGLHLEWNRGGLGLEIEVNEHGEVGVVVDDGGDITEWLTSNLGDDQLRSALSRITAG